MKSKKGFLVSLLLIVSLFVLSGCDKLVVFDPQGPVAKSLYDLITTSMIYMAVIIVVVFALFFYFVWKYRESAQSKDYEPPEDHGNTLFEVIWTIIPLIIVIALTIPTVKTLYAVEDVPKGYENQEPLVIHVTSADWKWIFSYEEEGIETVNYVNIPTGVPVEFKLTSAGTMQSFWIPALSGQKYTMVGAETTMYAVADNAGSYYGRNTNFNGKGYAGMEFEVEAKSPADFEEWKKDVKESAPKLTEDAYAKLLEPSNVGRQTFSNTHYEWVDHAKDTSKHYLNPELYRVHGYPGKTFTNDDTTIVGQDNYQENKEDADGGEEHGH